MNLELVCGILCDTTHATERGMSDRGMKMEWHLSYIKTLVICVKIKFKQFLPRVIAAFFHAAAMESWYNFAHGELW